jgi:hypothetical protein
MKNGSRGRFLPAAAVFAYGAEPARPSRAPPLLFDPVAECAADDIAAP